MAASNGNQNFNVNEFTQVITNIKNRTEAVTPILEKLSQNAELMQYCIGNQENPELYQKWGNMAELLDQIKSKYASRKTEFLTIIENYKLHTIQNNDEIFQDIQRAQKQMEDIYAQLGDL